MFGKKLSPVGGIDQTIIQTLKKYYSVAGGWDNTDQIVKDFKAQIKTLMNDNQDGRCGYCGLPLATRSPAIEHIAPKGGPIRPKHLVSMFDPKNLVYACHWCNSSSCKGIRETVASENESSDCEDWTYLLVHPYFDDPTEYFFFPKLENGENGPIPYAIQGIDAIHRQKAQFTLDMFKIHTESVMQELAKQYFADQRPDILRYVMDVSVYKPD